MQRLRIAARSDLSHTLDVASCRLEQPAQVLTRLKAHIAGQQPEERRKFLAEGQEPYSQSSQGRRWVMAFLLPVTGLAGVA